MQCRPSSTVANSAIKPVQATQPLPFTEFNIVLMLTFLLLQDSQAWRSRRGCRPTFRCWCLEVLALAMGAMVVATLWARQKPASHVRLPFVLPLYAGVFNASWQTHAPLKVSSTLDRHSPRRSLMTKSEAPKFISEVRPALKHMYMILTSSEKLFFQCSLSSLHACMYSILIYTQRILCLHEVPPKSSCTK